MQRTVWSRGRDTADVSQCLQDFTFATLSVSAYLLCNRISGGKKLAVIYISLVFVGYKKQVQEPDPSHLWQKQPRLAQSKASLCKQVAASKWLVLSIVGKLKKKYRSLTTSSANSVNCNMRWWLWGGVSISQRQIQQKYKCLEEADTQEVPGDCRSGHWVAIAISDQPTRFPSAIRKLRSRWGK